MLERILIAAILAAPLCAVADDKAKTPQQEKMANCNKEAGEKNLKGDEREKFMSHCLSMSQQDRMKACNKKASAKDLKGDERKQFMSECLKGPAKS